MNRFSVLGKSGMTLIEVLLSVALLGLFAAPVASMFFVTNKIVAYSRASMEASAMADRIIESIGPADISPTSPDGVSLTPEEYAAFNIDAGVYSVKKTISIALRSELSGDSGLTPGEGQYMLTLDTQVPGEISFPGYSLPKVTYSQESQAVLNIEFSDSGAVINDMFSIPKCFGYVCVVGGENNIVVNLKNNSSRDMTLYLSNMPQGRHTVVNAIPVISQWTEYDNLQYGVAYPTGSISLAIIKVSVTHLPTGKVYETRAEKPAYNFSFSAQ